MLKTKLNFLVIGLLLALSACSWIPVHQQHFKQGNIFTQEQVSKLKPGMTKQQVLFVMGAPVLDNPFRGDRWDYVYTKQIGDISEDKKSLTLYFNQSGKLAKLEGNIVPRVSHRS